MVFKRLVYNHTNAGLQLIFTELKNKGEKLTCSLCWVNSYSIICYYCTCGCRNLKLETDKNVINVTNSQSGEQFNAPVKVNICHP